MPDADDWQVVATAHFDLAAPRLWDQRRHHSHHYFLQTDGRRLVLSRAPVEPHRPPFDYQFMILRALLAAGFGKARLPLPARDGALYVCHNDCWWTLRPYGPSDPNPPWASAALVRQAARTLASLHQAAAVARALPDLDAHALDPFHWTSAEFISGLDQILDRFHWYQLDPGQRRRLQRSVRQLVDAAPGVLAAARRRGLVGVTHQDLRPVNCRVVGGAVVEVWDWDLARLDCVLYDLAFSCLQFGGRECLFPDTSLALAQVFIDEYVHTRRQPGLEGDVAALLPWFLRLVVLKRLLLNWHIPDRLRLLDQVEQWKPLHPQLV